MDLHGLLQGKLYLIIIIIIIVICAVSVIGLVAVDSAHK
jgi:hypothetical protein